MDSPPLPDGSIVVGIDGSAPAGLALEWAARQAALERRPLILVHASVSMHPTWLGPQAMNLEDLHLVEDREGREALQAADARASVVAPGLDVHQVLCWTDPRQELLEQSKHAAMVVIGSRGRGPVGSLLLGSVSVAVSSQAECPVVVLRPGSPGPADAPGSGPDSPRQGVLVGVQETTFAQAPLELAFHLASSRSLPLTVLQCSWSIGYDSLGQPIPSVDAGAPSGPPRYEPARAEAQAVLGAAVDAVSKKFPDVTVTIQHRGGYVDRQLVELSPSMDAVVVGSHRSSLLHRVVYGSLSHTVVEHARGAVVVVPIPADG